MHLPPQQPALAALRSEFTQRGFALQVAAYPDGRMYGAHVAPDMMVLIFDVGGRYFAGPPAGWTTEAWQDIPGQDEPVMVADAAFPLAAVVAVAQWAANIPYRRTRPAPSLLPAIPDPAPPAGFHRRGTQPLVWRAPQRQHPTVGTDLKARTVRPGRYDHESWPPQLTLQVRGPDRVARGRLWAAWVNQQPLGLVLAEAIPRPASALLRRTRTRTVWRAYQPADTGLTADLTFSGRESLRGALNVLTRQWMATNRALNA